MLSASAGSINGSFALSLDRELEKSKHEKRRQQRQQQMRDSIARFRYRKNRREMFDPIKLRELPVLACVKVLSG
jgi:hypothetical protein